jgi:general secretion pathway protein G
MSNILKTGRGMQRTARALALMDVMIAVAIMALLATLVGTNVMRYLERAKESSTKTVLAAVETAMQDYYQDIGHFPTKAEGGLIALTQQPRGEKYKGKWQGPYLERIEPGTVPVDGWDNPLELSIPPLDKKRFKYYQVNSYGKDGKDSDEARTDLFVGK